LEHLRINYLNVTGCQQFQVIDVDYWASICGRIEVKNSYKDDQVLILEDYHDYRPEVGSVRPGWFFTSKADLIVFVSDKTRTMVFLPMSVRLKEHYKTIRDQYGLCQNDPSKDFKSGNSWRSAFHRIPFSALEGFLSIYKKITGNGQTKLF